MKSAKLSKRQAVTAANARAKRFLAVTSRSLLDIGVVFFEVAGDGSLEPERERERPTVTEAVNGRNLSLGRSGAGVPVLGLGLRGLLARPVTQAN
jgi:hypothetical protein